MFCLLFLNASLYTVFFCLMTSRPDSMHRFVLSSVALATVVREAVASAPVFSRGLYNESTANHTCQLRKILPG